ncbi:hypothetical protein QQF64_032763 [Cirrhinus molitorella]|uniref:Uncharacterized protein n=2 Tax=Cirrhinus molitorella TaxID=172907 RepID=A0ABR3MS45_9TELE|nr:hypothetical protein Q8A67_006488 [Cirrhinus molitorella]
MSAITQPPLRIIDEMSAAAPDCALGTTQDSTRLRTAMLLHPNRTRLFLITDSCRCRFRGVQPRFRHACDYNHRI